MIESKNKRLLDFVKTIRDKSSTKDIYLEYEEDIKNVSPNDMFKVFSSLLDEGDSPEEILEYLDKVINVFYEPLANSNIHEANFTLLENMLENNKWLNNHMDSIKSLLKDKDIVSHKEEFKAKITQLQDFNSHYEIKENIIFPYLEKKAKNFEGLNIMWELHNQVKEVTKEAVVLLSKDNFSENEFYVIIGKLFFSYLGVAQKEELILFPTAIAELNDYEWKEMHIQSLEYEWPFIHIDKTGMSEIDKVNYSEVVFATKTGELSYEELLAILGRLSIDFTFVDKDNKVKFFSESADRVFPRSPAIIGRDVKNCHPPGSLNIVEEILEKFKSGEESSAKFWIKLENKVIMIQYFALRDKNNSYLGTLEVSQDITEIKNVEGERRLLDWGE